MKEMLNQIGLSLRLNFRNRMALIYGYLFPLIFLFAFWAIYRNDKFPLVLHLGELLTVTVLGGACFGLPTNMVGERERGIWRRYRLVPAPAWVFVASELVARYFLLITAALLQLALAMAIGMPAPRHPLGLWLAFTFVSVAFLGLGMEIAMLADNVPAVQALGQCIFLPMLMVGGIAVRLASLPRWALHVSAFFPGRYAVEALQDCATGNGLRLAHFDLLALLLIGAAGSIAAARMFRWDAKQRLAAQRGKPWIALALGMWVVVGLLAEFRGRIAVTGAPAEEAASAGDYLTSVPSTAMAKAPPPAASVRPVPGPPPAAAVPPSAAKHASSPRAGSVPLPRPAAASPSAARSVPHLPPGPSSWRAVTRQDIDGIAFERLPPDEGLVSPIASAGEEPDPAVAAQLEHIRSALPDWPPGKVDDPVQRARNYLYVAAVPDVLEMEEVERFVPLLVFEQLRRDIPETDLPKVLYWVAMHPMGGDDSAIGQLEPLGLPAVSGPSGTVRERVMLYSFKLLGRLTGHITRK